MPSKKPNKTAKKPGKALTGKVNHKAAAPKKAARSQVKHTPIAISKVTVKPNKPISKPTAPKTAAAMRELRSDLTQFWQVEGCAHLQIGKTYRFLESRQPEMRALLEGLKALVDPKGLINPGALGLN